MVRIDSPVPSLVQVRATYDVCMSAGRVHDLRGCSRRGCSVGCESAKAPETCDDAEMTSGCAAMLAVIPVRRARAVRFGAERYEQDDSPVKHKHDVMPDQLAEWVGVRPRESMGACTSTVCLLCPLPQRDLMAIMRVLCFTGESSCS